MILCIGEAVIDMVQTHVSGLGEVFLSLPGGCSYNTSIAIGRLGVPVSFLGRVSKNFFGEIQVKRLRESNVKSDLIIRCEQNPVLAFIKVEEGIEPQYAFYDEGTADRLLSIEHLPQLPASATCIVFGSISMTMEPIATTIETFIEREAEREKVIAFDPNIRAFMIKDREDYLKRFEKWTGASTIVKISYEDFEYITPKPEPEEALRRILALGSRLAIITLGPKGAAAMLRRGDGSVIRASSPAAQIPEVADTVGAGDTFHGAFLVWLEQRGKLSCNAIAGLSETDLLNALVFANKAAAVVCTRRGAEPPSLEEIEKVKI
jgi:fructokinase